MRPRWAACRTACGGALLAWAGGFALLLALLPFDITIYDEGSILTGAENVLAGKLPTLDFWTIYPAGAYVWVAGVLALFDHQLIAVRVVGAALLALGPALCFGLVRRRWDAATAAVAAAAVALWIAGTHPNFVYPPPLVVLLAVPVVVAAGDRPRGLAGMALLGAASGGLATLRLDFAFFAWIATALAIGVAGAGRVGARLWRVAAFGAGAAAVLLAAALIYARRGGLAALAVLVQRLLLFPAGPFHRARDLPLPVPFAAMAAGREPVAPGLVNEELVLVLFYAVAAGLLLTLGWLLAGMARRRRVAPLKLALLLFAVLSIIPFLGRSNYVQGWPFATLGAIVLLAVAAQRWMLLTLAVALIAVGGINVVRAANDDYRAPTAALNAPRAHGIRLTQRHIYYNDVLAWATRATTLYSGPDGHQHVNANDTMLYFLSGHQPIGGYYEAHPLITDSAAVQTSILDAFRRTPPDTVITVRQQREEPNQSAVDSGVTLLDDALAQACSERMRSHEYRILTCRW